MINARVETVHEKPAFHRAFLKRRCLLPADGFDEWQQAEDPATCETRKQPYFIHPEDDQVIALAGLYEYWRNPELKQDDDPTAWPMTCTIITTEATDTAGRVHPRMLLALTPDHYDIWLDPAIRTPTTCRPCSISPQRATWTPGPPQRPSITSTTTALSCSKRSLSSDRRIAWPTSRQVPTAHAKVCGPPGTTCDGSRTGSAPTLQGKAAPRLEVRSSGVAVPASVRGRGPLDDSRPSSDDSPPLAQHRAGGRELPRALGDQRADHHPEAHRLASVPAYRTRRARLLPLVLWPPLFFRAVSIAGRSATRARSMSDASPRSCLPSRGVAEVQVTEVGQALHGRDGLPGEQALR